MDEFQFIAKLLSPLAPDKAALKLKDDAAVIDVPSGQQMVVTKDAMVEGVHFIGNEPADLIARKLLRVNLSDLAAMGAKPYGYFLALMLPPSKDEAWLTSFAQGLAQDQAEFNITLLGGDTTRSKAVLGLSLTAMGHVTKGMALQRSGAKSGDDVYVSGIIGDGALGLLAAENKITSPEALTRYQLPEPRLALGQALHGIATACMDVSDGLVQDLDHICALSEVGATLQLDTVPLSDAFRASSLPVETAVTGGDDYELLFTAPASAAPQLKQIAAETGIALTRIGSITASAGVKLLDASGKEVSLTTGGYKHF